MQKRIRNGDNLYQLRVSFIVLFLFSYEISMTVLLCRFPIFSWCNLYRQSLKSQMRFFTLFQILKIEVQKTSYQYVLEGEGFVLRLWWDGAFSRGFGWMKTAVTHSFFKNVIDYSNVFSSDALSWVQWVYIRPFPFELIYSYKKNVSSLSWIFKGFHTISIRIFYNTTSL